MDEAIILTFMLWAVDEKENEVYPIKGYRAICPICHTAVTSKMYRAKKPHFAHISNRDCDKWSEGETEWHYSWKELVRNGFYERVIYPHRADILGNNNTVIELQHSPISGDNIEQREKFYGEMIWLLDGVSYFKGAEISSEGGTVSFRFQYPRQSFTYFKKPIFAHLHCGNLIEIDRLAPKYIRGNIISWRSFVDRYLSQVIKDEYNTPTYPDIVGLREDIIFAEHFDTNCFCPEQPSTKYCFSFRPEKCDHHTQLTAVDQLDEKHRSCVRYILENHPECKLKDILLLEKRLYKLLPDYDLYRELISNNIWDVHERADSSSLVQSASMEYPYSYTTYRSLGQFEDLVDTPPDQLRYSFAFPEYIRFFILFRFLDHPAIESVLQELTSDNIDEANRAIESLSGFIYNMKLCDPPYSYFDIRDDVKRFSKRCKERGFITSDYNN